MEQIELNFEAGLIEQFPEFQQCLKASVYSCGKPFKAVAADLDMSSSRLSRMLNENDENIHFPAYRVPELMKATGDIRPIYWLVETFCRDADERQKAAVRQFMAEMPKMMKLMEKIANE
jgi:hypothetical protein